MKVLIRANKPEDIAFIFDSYLKSWRLSKFAGTVPNHLYFETQRQLLEGLLGRGAKVSVAYPEGHEDAILGWICYEEKEGKAVIHYVYIKDSYAGLGVADQLVESVPGAKPGFITHKMFLASLKDWIHAPEIARRKSL